MTRTEITRELNTLYDELRFAREADEQTVCLKLNADSREEAIQATNDEIECLERWLAEMDSEWEEPEDDGMDYVNLQLSQGLPVVYC